MRNARGRAKAGRPSGEGRGAGHVVQQDRNAFKTDVRNTRSLALHQAQQQDSRQQNRQANQNKGWGLIVQ